jgi:Ca2+-binding EF-hand superfamily protein
VDEDEVDEILMCCDENGDGVIDYSEFVTAAVNRDKMLAQNRIR